MLILHNIKKIFEANPQKGKCLIEKSACVFYCNDEIFGAVQISKILMFVNSVHSKYKNIKVPIYIAFNKRLRIIDKLSYVILECICYSLIKDFGHAVSISWNIDSTIVTQGVFSSPLAILNNNIPKASLKYIDAFNFDIYRCHFRKVIYEDKTDTNYLGDLQQDIYNFLSAFGIEEEYKDDIAEMIVEIVGNAIEHANSQCLLDIDVTTDHSKSIESEVQDGMFYGINIVILNYSEVLFGDRVKSRLKNDELNTNDRYRVLKEAYKNHQKLFTDKYGFDDFCNLASIQHRISGEPNKGKAGGHGLTKLIKSLQGKSDMYNCYLLSGRRVIAFDKELLEYDDNEWLGLNRERNFINNIPDEKAIQECLVYFPGTAYNLNFIMKREESISDEDGKFEI